MKNEKIRKIVIDITGLSLLILAAGCAGLLYIVNVEGVRLWYTDIQSKLLEFEKAVASIDDLWVFFIVIALLYISKALVPIISTSVICVITGTVMPVYFALPVNVAGIMISFSIMYFVGRKFGGGNARKFINKNNKVKSLLEHGGKGNPWLLVAFRIVPNIPVNSVSRLYGQMRFKYVYFIMLSLLGYSPKLISYTIIGRNVYDPLSAAFLTPIIVLLSISGLSLLFINAIWNFVGKKRLKVQDIEYIEQN